jgi:hypothetical protein
MLAILALGLAAIVTPATAHHSVRGEYDTSRILSLHGAVSKIEWLNPHAHFWLDAQSNDGRVSTWELELPAPNALLKENIRRDFLKQGDRVALVVWGARDGSSLAHVLTLTFADGRAFNFPRQWGPAMSALR